jgi:hypothetical protein
MAGSSRTPPRTGPTGGSAERGGAVAPTFEIERRAQTVPGERRPGEPPLGSPQATAWGPGSSGSAVSGGASPLNVDRLVEVRSTRGRQPMTVEIVREASQIRDPDNLRDAMVVFCDLSTGPLVTAGLAHGAKEARLFAEVQEVVDYAEEHFRFPTQRVIGGAVPLLDPDTTDREPLEAQELAEITAEYDQASADRETADREVGRLGRMEKMLQKSFAAPSQSLGRLSNPARSTAALKKQQAEAAASFTAADATVARLQRLVETKAKPRELVPAELRADWREPVATRYHQTVTNRTLLLSAPAGVEAMAPLLAAKRLVLCCFANLDSVRERVLAWWSSVSTIDAHQHPDINTRVVLVCGPTPPAPTATAAATDGSAPPPRTMRLKVAVPLGARGGSTMEITANGGIKHTVVVPEGLSEGMPFDVDIPLPPDDDDNEDVEDDDDEKTQKKKAKKIAFTDNTASRVADEDSAEEEGELPAAQLLAGVLLFQLLQCADVEMADLSPDGPTRQALRTVLEASREVEEEEQEEEAGQERLEEAGWRGLQRVLQRQVLRHGLARGVYAATLQLRELRVRENLSLGESSSSQVLILDCLPHLPKTSVSDRSI